MKVEKSLVKLMNKVKLLLDNSKAIINSKNKDYKERFNNKNKKLKKELKKYLMNMSKD